MSKKQIILTIALAFCLMPAVAVTVNEPGPPVRLQQKQAAETPAATNNSASASANSSPSASTGTTAGTPASDSSSDSSGDIAKLNSLAMSMLRAAERHDQAGMQPYFRKMIEMGIDSYFQPQVIAKKTPQCPPIKMELNGRHLSGSLCAKTGYVYKGKEYWVGYCK